MLSRFLITSIVSFFILLSCQDYSNKGKANFNQITFSEFGGSEEKSIVWVQNLNEWKSIHSKLNKHRYPTPAPEDYDFKNLSFLVINFGQRNNGGFSATVEDVKLKDDSVLIYLNKKSPNANSLTTSVITSPYIVLSIPKTTTKPVQLINTP